MPSLYIMCPSRWTTLLLLLSTVQAIHMAESNEAHGGSMSAFLRGGNNNIDLELNNLHNLEDEIILEEQSKLDDIHQEKRQLQEKMKLRKERQTLLNLEIARLRALLAD